MRKRSGRPPKFAAVPNESIDDSERLDLTALGLLTVLLRHQDGWDITLAEIGEKYGYGRDAMARAMGLLQVARYVVKVRIMSAEDGQWSTEVVVYDTPAEPDEIAELLEEISRQPGVRKAAVIQPTKAAIAEAEKRKQKLQKRAPQPPPGLSFSVPSKDNKDKSEPKRPTPPPAAPAPAGTPPASPPTSSKKPKSGLRMSREVANSVRAVESKLPPVLREMLPQHRPPVLRDVIVEALATRSADQLAERATRRWWMYEYERETLPGGKGIQSPVGVAVSLLRPSQCPDPMCEDGVVMDTKMPCRACEVRDGDRRQKRSGVPDQRKGRRASAITWACAECEIPGTGRQPDDHLCRGCRQEAAAARAAARELEESLAQDEAERAKQAAAEAWEELLQQAYSEHAARERQAATLETAERRRQAEAEETRRRRERIARENPDMAAYSAEFAGLSQQI